MVFLRDWVVGHLPLRMRWSLAQRGGYELATRYLDGLTGVEIGAAAHNRYPVDAFNVDLTTDPHPNYIEEQRRLAGRVATVHVVAAGDKLPLADKSIDFVLASHVIEHFPDPIRALLEWDRVATRYLFLVVPHRDRTFDAERPLTSTEELLDRHAAGFTADEDKHWSVWTCETFVELCERIGLDVVATEDPDLKVGNGFAIVVAVDPSEPLNTVRGQAT